MSDRIQLRGDISTNWASVNPVLAQREVGLEIDTNKLKVGDGITHWNNLSYYNQLGNLTGLIKGTGYNDYIVATPGTDYLDTNALLEALHNVDITNPQTGNILSYNGSEWINTVSSNQVGAGSGVNLYPTTDASDVNNYYYFEKFPDAITNQTDINVVVNNSTSTLAQWISNPSSLVLTHLNGGVWQINLWAYANASNSKITISVAKRDSEGIETTLFSFDTPELSTTASLYRISNVQVEHNISSTDRLIVRLEASTTNTTDTTVHVLGGSSEYFSYFITPLISQHNDLYGLQGGNSNGYYHLTSSQLDNLNNQSGVNTGDQVITLTGDVTATGSTTFPVTISGNSVTNAKLSQMSANTYKGNASISIANASDIPTKTAFNVDFETSISNIKTNGITSVGELETVARADHIHPVLNNRNNTSCTFISAANSGSQAISSGGVVTKITFSETQDMLGEFANNRFTSLSDQIVDVRASIIWPSMSSLTYRNNIIYIYKNGSEVYRTSINTNSSHSSFTSYISYPILIYTNEYIEIYASTSDTSQKNITGVKLVITQKY